MSLLLRVPPKVVAGATTNYGKGFIGTRHWTAFALFGFSHDQSIDSASGFDTPDRSVFDLNNVAVFKFQISSWFKSNHFCSHGITTLGLVGVDGISSACPVAL